MLKLVVFGMIRLLLKEYFKSLKLFFAYSFHDMKVIPKEYGEHGI
jgi:hypothetical protein